MLLSLENLRALAGVLFVCFIDLFYFFPRLRKAKKSNKTKNTPVQCFLRVDFSNG